MLSWIQVQAIDAHSILNVLLSVSSASKELDGDKCAGEDRKRVTDSVRNMMKGCPPPGRDLTDLSLAEAFKRIGCQLYSTQYCGLQDQYFALLRGISFTVCPEMIVDQSKKSAAMDVQSACLKSSHHNALFSHLGPAENTQAQQFILKKCAGIDEKTTVPKRSRNSGT